MANEPIEVLTVKLEADFSTLVQQTKEGVNQSEKELDKLSEAPKKSLSAWEQFGSFLSTKFLGIITMIGAAIAAAFSVGAVVNFFKTIAGGMIDVNKQFETFTTQFTTLLGTTSEAKKRIDELAQFGLKTPFELDEIVEANRLLQTFGGTALATGENLRRIGDSAAAVNANFKEVSFWTGRLYSSMMAGRPFGEASARLQELGILSGDVRTKLEDMQKSGAKGTEIWAAYSSMIDDRFTGAMDRLSKTLQGVMSNLADFQSMLLREGGEELFEGVREDVVEFYDIISQPEAQEALVNLSKAFGSILDALREAVTTPFLEQLREIDPDKAEHLAASIQDIGEAIGSISGQNLGSLEDLVETVDDLAQSTASIIQFVSAIKELGFAGSGLNAVGEALDRLNVSILDLTPLGAVSTAFGNMNSEVERLTGSSISEWLGNVDEEMESVATTGEHAFDALQAGAKKVAEAAQDTQEAAEDFTKVREKFEGLAASFLEVQEDLNEKREELEQEHTERETEIINERIERVAGLEGELAGERAKIATEAAEKIAKIEQEAAEERTEIAANTVKALANLEQETADARAAAHAEADAALAGLEAGTQSKVAQIQADAREKERRETEDHQREMQRLRADYLLNLEDAVKSRDARAIVDLRRKYTQEKQEREEDFRTQQTRNREEARKRVDEAREAEEERRREIEKALQKQLEEIEKNEAKKRAEIEASHKEQLAAVDASETEKRDAAIAAREEDFANLSEYEAKKRAEIDASFNEQIAREQEHYTEAQAALDQALQEKLEAVAQSLAEEKEITEAGAQAILETLNESYETGLDQFSAYLERRRQLAEAAAALEENLTQNSADSTTSGQGGTLPESQGGAGLPEFALGGVIPGQPGQKRLVIAHAGELVIPPDQTSRFLQQQGEVMAMNGGGRGGPMVVELKVSGSAPPGIGGGEVEQIAGTLVKALNEAGINARRR